MAKFYSSRLEKKEDEEITKKTVVMGVVTILVLIMVLVFGLPFLIKVSVLLGEVKNKNAKEQIEKIMPPLPPRLIVNYEATNSAIISVSGLAEATSKVKLLKNDVSLGEVVTQISGEFVFTNISLDEGENQLAAFASSEKSGSSEMSKVVTIIYDKVAPPLTMTNPSEDSLKVDVADFDVVGQSEKDVSVTVNNRYAMVDDTGKFKIKFQLNAGKNDIEVVVRDLAGNETKKKISITFEF
ncbi:hypothetical protein CO009_01220 [Candidatus Shapirobacteria bacterium CG_4_8_14_3_um_filter_35_11]|uniref:Bacterial Ig-like domain-containing protein n=5 Tax=Candidatus Shapironibacteriota TaxID=1752721 RepID=A0A1J5I3M6_9BACT|nr:MAG: hypothetical protein AUK05_00455 [Candidatus Shapirobacteria bacterium CG2_30_35_20]PIX68366.1 MAG: hypothetical protein COZ41_00045 [Candidatus Shapirobacteria bacterium CG_4_10_14_3_um_filter_35_13]PJA51279.1 MAG: hypothetical protein CO168_00620 [Candidatus Shapirobacteria bacterium CG_4_9_14_3_um_filter_36_12]PJC80727.1 MAG: hypothetical protein CO009_01220 [Candidatus Shapirobacteria bacterium CG_4_8_14_3_um_filter_35_11]PJE66899.1 MAG: hypothetical protein COU93_01755 [Candidatus 